LGAGDVNGIDLLPGLIFQAAGQTDEVDGGDNDRGHHWGLDPDEIDEQQEVHECKHMCTIDAFYLLVQKKSVLTGQNNSQGRISHMMLAFHLI
jgi:hypothetical protein